MRLSFRGWSRSPWPGGGYARTRRAEGRRSQRAFNDPSPGKQDKAFGGVGQDVTLAALDLLARVITAWPAALGGLHALTVDHSGAWRGLAPRRQTRGHQQQVVDRLSEPVVAPGIEVALNRCHRREVPGQHPPRLTAAQDVEHSVQDRPTRPLRRPAKSRNRRKKRLKVSGALTPPSPEPGWG